MGLAFLKWRIKKQQRVRLHIYNSLIIPLSGRRDYILGSPGERKRSCRRARSLPCIKPSHLTKTKVIIPGSVKQKKWAQPGLALLLLLQRAREKGKRNRARCISEEERTPIGRLRVYYLHTQPVPQVIMKLSKALHCLSGLQLEHASCLCAVRARERVLAAAGKLSHRLANFRQCVFGAIRFVNGLRNKIDDYFAAL